MIAPRHLARAPIKEGLIDIRVASETPITIQTLDVLYASFSSRYPKKETMWAGGWEIRFDADNTAPKPLEKREIGYRYTSEDGKHIAQFRTDGFTFSRLEPYQTWEIMRDEAIALWKIYVDAVKPISITRIATRYINVLNIPLPIADFRDYLTAPPEVPKDLPQGISSFLTRVVMHEPSLKAGCILTQAFEGTANDFVPITLDIDVFVSGRPPSDATADEHWTILEQLRHFKNRVFFDSITEKTAELFQ